MDHHLRALILHSFIQKINCTIIFFHPDCTVGFGVSVCSHCRRITESCPADLYSERLVGYTTGWDLHPTLKNFTFINVLSI